MKASEIVEAIKTVGQTVNLAIHGPPAVGKTATVHAAKRELQKENPDFRFVGLRANLLEPVDVTGIIFPDHESKVAKWYVPEFLPREGTEGLLFIDEFPQATMAVQCALMKLVDELPNGWRVVLAGNRSTDRAGAGQVATHVLSRFTHVDFEVSREDWQKWALESGVDYRIRSFIDFRPGLLFQFDAQDRQKLRAGCDPRSWERASNVLKNAPENIRLQLLQGTVGNAAAAELQNYIEISSICPTPEIILANPTTTHVPSEPSALYAICGALAERAKKLAKPELENLIIYLSRLPIEFGALLMTDCLAVAPGCLMVPAAGKWITDHKEVFATARK